MDYPKNVPSVGLVDGKFVNEDVLAGLPGSLIPATWGNSVTDELLNVVKSAGLEPSEADATQLLQAVKKISQAGEDKHATDIGAANLYMANYAPAVTALKDGLALRFTAGNANTGASTFAPNGLMPKPLVNLASGALRPAEIVRGSVCSVIYSGALESWVLESASGGKGLSGQLLGVKTFTASGNYVPTVGMKNVLVTVIGGGGGSSGIGATNSTEVSLTGGGASGSYAQAWLSSGVIGQSQIITVGAGGAAGVVGTGGGSGGTSSLGSLVSATGGGGSPWNSPLTLPGFGLYVGGFPSQPSVGGNIVNSAGAAGNPGMCLSGSTLAGHGANSPFGNGGYASSVALSLAAPGSGYGSGAGGIANTTNQPGRPGAAGASGAVIIYEYA
ncbi:Phage tail protein [Pseudomonas sp. IT-347P]|uniref:glycine-rich domain-containing protein n=1 Tax=Pseudomonas sp. IT-347P TaxID=3026458 RepID=UPI0039E040A0